jgi:sugar/nucleoside kinase (ribokinase family)
VDEFPQANSKVVAHSQDVFLGGPATNAAITFAHLGGKSTLVTGVGRHALCSMVREEIKRYSIELLDLNPNSDKLPAISSISVNKTGERNIVSANATGVSLPPAQVDEAALAEASVVLVDGHYMQACQAWSRAACAREARVVLDAGSWKDGTEELLKSIHTAICSADFRPPGCLNEASVFKYLKDRGVTNIAITNGAEPIRFVSEQTSGIVQVPQVQLVDSMGAGDIFHGAFCFYISIGCEFEEALRKSARVAAGSCRFHGAREWMTHSISEPPSGVERQNCAKLEEI